MSGSRHVATAFIYFSIKLRVFMKEIIRNESRIVSNYTVYGFVEYTCFLITSHDYFRTSSCHVVKMPWDSQPFRSRANSLPGANWPIEPWPIRSVELSLPGLIAPWPSRSLEPSLPGPFAPWSICSLALSFSCHGSVYGGRH